MHCNVRAGWALVVLLMTVAALALASPANGQDAVEATAPSDAAVGDDRSTSFAEAFFISKVTLPSGETRLDLFGSALLWILLLLSVLSVGLIGMMVLTNQRRSFLPTGVADQVRRLLATGKFKEAIELTAADQSYFSRVLHASLREASHGYSAVIRSLEESSDALATARLRRIEYLNILAQISPMIGLFGTVWGMILAFNAIVSAGGNADPVLLAGGIGTALTTTFWGLIIAIPALAAYALIRNRIDEFATEATRAAEALLNEFRPKASSAPVGATAGPAAARPAPAPMAASTPAGPPPTPRSSGGHA